MSAIGRLVDDVDDRVYKEALQILLSQSTKSSSRGYPLVPGLNVVDGKFRNTARELRLLDDAEHLGQDRMAHVNSPLTSWLREQSGLVRPPAVLSVLDQNKIVQGQTFAPIVLRDARVQHLGERQKFLAALDAAEAEAALTGQPVRDIGKHRQIALRGEFGEPEFPTEGRRFLDMKDLRAGPRDAETGLALTDFDAFGDVAMGGFVRPTYIPNDEVLEAIRRLSMQRRVT
jgi:hypothetical protein